MTVEELQEQQLHASAAFISCRLDYCNSLFYGLPDTLLLLMRTAQPQWGAYF